MAPTDITAEADGWLGAPWKHQGRSKDGCDCIGLVIGVARSFDIPVTDQIDYARAPNDFTLHEALAAHRLCRVTEPTIGSVVLFRLLRFPQHVGIDCGDSFIHAYQPTRKVCRYPWNDKWRKRIVARYCFEAMGD